jgi:hypothetical protein
MKFSPSEPEEGRIGTISMNRIRKFEIGSNSSWNLPLFAEPKYCIRTEILKRITLSSLPPSFKHTTPISPVSFFFLPSSAIGALPAHRPRPSSCISRPSYWAFRWQGPFKIMIMRMLATLDKAKPDIESTRGSNLAAITCTTVQVSKSAVVALATTCCTEPGPTWACIYCLYYTYKTWKIGMIHVHIDKGFRLWLTEERLDLSSQRAPEQDTTVTVEQLTNIWSWAQNGAQHQDILTDQPSVVIWLSDTQMIIISWLRWQ